MKISDLAGGRLILSIGAVTLLLLAIWQGVLTMRSFHSPQFKTPLAVPVRAYLFTDEPTPEGFGAYGYLLLNGRPSAAEVIRYQQVCDIFRQKLVPAWGDSTEDRALQMVTFWPLALQHTYEIESFSCRFLMRNYNYRFASGVTTAIGKQDARGPLLAAWRKPFGQSNSDALVLDLSDFSDEDLERALSIWRTRITMDPSVWQEGFKLVLFREAFRSLLQKYGETILAVVQPSKAAP